MKSGGVSAAPKARLPLAEEGERPPRLRCKRITIFMWTNSKETPPFLCRSGG